jgi:hypothetical protein
MRALSRSQNSKRGQVARDQWTVLGPFPLALLSTGERLFGEGRPFHDICGSPPDTPVCPEER